MTGSFEVHGWPRQLPDQVPDISAWLSRDDHSVFPVGSKPKRLIICPDDTTLPFLIPGHSYLFKTAENWRAQQLWSEVIAYEISKICGVDVPPCFVARDSQTQKTGALIEFFYGYPDNTQPARLVHGTDINQRFYRDYDPKAGRPHSVIRNVTLGRHFRVQTPLEWWSKTLCFDALIGNTDRHAENWGLLRRPPGSGMNEWTLSPVFDNGTSLGYEVKEQDLASASEPKALAKHVAKGTHHCTFGEQISRKGDHLIELCVKFCEVYPQAKKVMERVIPTPDAPIADLLNWCTTFEIPVAFSEARAEFVGKLIAERRKTLVQRLGF